MPYKQFSRPAYTFLVTRFHVVFARNRLFQQRQAITLIDPRQGCVVSANSAVSLKPENRIKERNDPDSNSVASCFRLCGGLPELGPRARQQCQLA